MTSQELRKEFLKFFESNDHKIIPSAPLVPKEDEQLAGKEKVLFTSAGMQPLIPYLLGKPHPEGKKLADVQKCLRTDDIEEVGDDVHHTFFEMLGSWSLGDYWKDEAIRLSFEFLTKELEIPTEKMAITVFAGDEDVPKDEESANEWEKQGIPKERIFYFSKEYNWWPTGENSGPCGPDTEMFYWIGEGAPEGKPNEDPRWVEIWNDVFMQYNRKEDGSLEELPQKNVDTGMGLERTVAVLNEKDNAYETDLFEPMFAKMIETIGDINDARLQRIRKFLDHTRAALFLISEGVLPGKNGREYVLRRLVRSATDQITILLVDVTHTKSFIWWEQAVRHFELVYKGIYDFKSNAIKIIKTELEEYGEEISTNVVKVESKISVDKRLNKQILSQNAQKYLGIPDGESFMNKYNFTSLPSVAAGSVAFDAKSTMGFPIQGAPGTATIAESKLGDQFVRSDFERSSSIFSEAHQEKSRNASAGMFKGGLAGHSEIEIKYHTATHLLHQALRDVLGPEVFQKGSNINEERLRFDFSYDKKMTEEEIKKVEDTVNQKIKEDLVVERLMMTVPEAEKMNAIGLFTGKYDEMVSIYAVGPDYKLDPEAKDQRERAGYYSAEFCGGPHVEHTGVIGRLKITKEEAVSAGIRRIYAELN